MNVKQFSLALAFILATCGMVPAQQPGEPGDKPRPKRHERSCLRGDGSLDIRRTTECLEKELAMDADQSASLKKFMDGYKAKSRELRQQYSPPPETIDRLKSLRGEMTAARESKDMDAMKTLLAEMHKIREEEDARKAPMIESLSAVHGELLAQVRGTLRPDQAAKLESLWTNRIVAPNEKIGFRGKQRSAQALKAMVNRLPGLSSEQKEQLETLFRNHMTSVRDAGSDVAARNQLVDKLYNDVMPILTSEQQERIEKDMQSRRNNNVDLSGDSEKKDEKEPSEPKSPAQNN